MPAQRVIEPVGVDSAWAARDLRIDVFRGVALFMVLVNHLESWAGASLVMSWSLISLGFSDAAEIFVFLSGYVFAIAYTRVLNRDGLAACVRKAARRSVQIYIAYLLAAWTIIGIGAMTLDLGPPMLNDAMRVGEDIWGSFLATLTCQFHAQGYDILAFYIPLLPIMAVILYVHQVRPWLAWLISGGLYLLVQFQPSFNLPRFGDGDPWYFNPFAWQFLFFLGIAVSSGRRQPLNVAPRWLLLALAGGMLALGLFVMKLLEYLVEADPGLIDTLAPFRHLYWNWADKTTLGPLRLLHFFALVYVVSRLLPDHLAAWSSRWARPLSVCGQHSLEAYACGLVLSFLGAFIILSGWSSVLTILSLDIVACLALVAWARTTARWKGAQPARALMARAAHQAASPTVGARQQDRHTATRKPKQSSRRIGRR